jgi:hypothetical protein
VPDPTCLWQVFNDMHRLKTADAGNSDKLSIAGARAVPCSAVTQLANTVLKAARPPQTGGVGPQTPGKGQAFSQTTLPLGAGKYSR